MGDDDLRHTGSDDAQLLRQGYRWQLDDAAGDIARLSAADIDHAEAGLEGAGVDPQYHGHGRCRSGVGWWVIVTDWRVCSSFLCELQVTGFTLQARREEIAFLAGQG